MKKLAEYLSVEDAAVLMRKTADEIGASEVAVVRNLGYVYSPVEVYPL
ncbi:MAG: hypothetical protein GYA63_08590, partial [Armatimonadetes bacterium]|nr:hypothetical protein [Armatimonadota bacterium]